MKTLAIEINLDVATDRDEIRKRVLAALEHGFTIADESWVSAVKKGVPYETRCGFWLSPHATALSVKLIGRG